MFTRLNTGGESLNAVIYARYSPGFQQIEQSIERQLRKCISYAKKFDISIVEPMQTEHKADNHL